MRLPRFVRRSIGLTQAIAVLLVSLIISLALGAVQLGYTFSTQREAALALSEEILTLAEGGATTASWTLDEQLAEQVIRGVIALGDVQSATLVDESGAVLASAEREARTYGAITSFFAREFYREPVHGQRALTVEAGGEVQRVGTFSIVFAPEHMASSFLNLAIPVLITVLMQALAIGLVFLWLSSRLLTSPLQRAARAIAEIDPENPRAAAISIPPFHKDDELGHLLGHTNQMVEQLGAVQGQLRLLATHDPLTGLPNRSFVVNSLERAIARAARNGTRVAVLFLDLDDFKEVNDSHGHDHGDDLLVQVARRLLNLLRSNDSVGRLGGDEFLIVIEDISSADDAMTTVRRVEAMLTQPFATCGYEFAISCSIGVAIYPDDGADATVLMRHSDVAMYQAKTDPGTRYRFFSPEMSERLQARLSMEAALRKALENEEFRLAYQPKFEASSGNLSGCEALLRWQKDGRLLVAGEFIQVAEQSGLMVEIGYQVMEWACAQARDWSTRYMPIPVAVNVSAQQIREPDFADRVIEIARRHRLKPQLLELEITETVLIEELGHSVEKLERLRSAGFVVSIDDFGTGYSSLSYLTHLPAHSLKIDRSFVSGPQSSEVVLNMIIAMAHALELTIVAEGVETTEQRDRLIAKGCDMLQGYLLGKPKSAAEFELLFSGVEA